MKLNCRSTLRCCAQENSISSRSHDPITQEKRNAQGSDSIIFLFFGLSSVSILSQLEPRFTGRWTLSCAQWHDWWKTAVPIYLVTRSWLLQGDIAARKVSFSSIMFKRRQLMALSCYKQTDWDIYLPLALISILRIRCLTQKWHYLLQRRRTKGFIQVFLRSPVWVQDICLYKLRVKTGI